MTENNGNIFNKVLKKIQDIFGVENYIINYHFVLCVPNVLLDINKTGEDLGSML